MTALYVLSSIGGATAFFGAIVVVIRAVTGQVSATKENTLAVNALTDKINKLTETQEEHTRDISYLKGRVGP